LEGVIYHYACLEVILLFESLVFVLFLTRKAIGYFLPRIEAFNKAEYA
jgi:hypothetical protein